MSHGRCRRRRPEDRRRRVSVPRMRRAASTIDRGFGERDLTLMGLMGQPRRELRATWLTAMNSIISGRGLEVLCSQKTLGRPYWKK